MGVASAAAHPERVLGLHFFNPVHRMPLVEVIQTESTSPEALATAFGFVLDMGKTPVLVAETEVFSYAHGVGPLWQKRLPPSPWVLLWCLAQARQLAQIAANSLPRHLYTRT